ncbi:uncharacterized protein LOC110386596 [Bombyx mori]
MLIFEIILLYVVSGPSHALTGGTSHNITTCEEFERGARFDPYAIIDSMWKIFYFWANTTEINPIVFSLPAKKRLAKFKEVIEAIEPHLEVEWQKATMFMTPRPGVEVLLLHATTPGAFRALVKQEQRHKARPQPVPLVKFADIRIKLVNQFMGMMCCEDLTAYALARTDSIPTTEKSCKEAADKIGYKGPDGRSYLFLQKRQIDDEF